MNLEDKIVEAINKTLRNPIYQSMKLLNIKSILKSANFVKKREGGKYLFDSTSLCLHACDE